VEIWRYRLIPIQAPLSLGVKMARSMQSRGIPTELSLEHFRQFVLPHLTVGRLGPAPKLSLHALFNYILKLLYLGCQWKELPIAKDAEGPPEIHYTRIYGAFRRWQAGGCFDIIFTVVVPRFHQSNLLDMPIIHGDGTTTAAKKGGDNIRFNGHKKIKGDKVVAFCDRNCNVIAPLSRFLGTTVKRPSWGAALPNVMRIARSVDVITQQRPPGRVERVVPGREGAGSRLPQHHNIRHHHLPARRAAGRSIRIHLRRRRAGNYPRLRRGFSDADTKHPPVRLTNGAAGCAKRSTS
jgi:hypothetical protein